MLEEVWEGMGGVLWASEMGYHTWHLLRSSFAVFRRIAMGLDDWESRGTKIVGVVMEWLVARRLDGLLLTNDTNHR